MRVESEEDFVDIDLPLVESVREPDGRILLRGRGNLSGARVALSVRLSRDWKAQKVEGADFYTYWGTAELESLGAESDSFTRALGELYGFKSSIASMPPNVEVQAVGLNDNPEMALDQAVKMKLFFAADNEDDYAEVYLNVDVGARTLAFHEKDLEYRQNLVRALGGST